MASIVNLFMISVSAVQPKSEILCLYFSQITNKIEAPANVVLLVQFAIRMDSSRDERAF